MAPNARRPRLVDIAARLDVAPSTVSRALAGSDSVSSRTRARVEQAAREMGYKGNPAASGLKRGQTMNIGLVAVMNHWYTGAVTAGADRVAAELGYDFVVVSSAAGAGEHLLLERAGRLGTRVDGALIVDVTTEHDVLDRLIEALAVPVVLLGGEAQGVSSVQVDNLDIGARAAAHLSSLGHRDAVVLALEPPSSTAANHGAQRAGGFRCDFGSSKVEAVFLSREDREDRQSKILAHTVGVTAVFCASDALAIETVSLLREAGRSVPGDVSVVGVDDHPLSQPIGLTTVAQSPEAMGEAAAEQLLAEIAGQADPLAQIVETNLVTRTSTAPPPAN